MFKQILFLTAIYVYMYGADEAAKKTASVIAGQQKDFVTEVNVGAGQQQVSWYSDPRWNNIPAFISTLLFAIIVFWIVTDSMFAMNTIKQRYKPWEMYGILGLQIIVIICSIIGAVLGCFVLSYIFLTFSFLVSWFISLSM